MLRAYGNFNERFWEKTELEAVYVVVYWLCVHLNEKKS